MSFEERNKAWNGGQREFRQLHTRSGVPQVKFIRVDGNQIVTSHGRLGGALQTQVETLEGINLGKKNQKTGGEYALERAKKKCDDMHWEGYREFDAGLPLDPPVETALNFDDLPTSFTTCKPQNTMNAKMEKLAEAGKAVYTRKRNGLAFKLVKGNGKAYLASRTNLRQHDDEFGTSLTWDVRFQHIVEVADRVMPPNSMILGELIVDRDGNDDMAAIQSLTKSLTLQAVEDQKKTGYASLYMWDVAFWDGVDLLSKAPVQARYDLIHEIEGERVLLPIEICPFASTSEAVEHAKKNDWEGWVVVDPEGVFGDKAYNFKGKPDRPAASCKLKPTYEDDFVAVYDPDNGYGERSTKERNGRGIKCVALYQYDKSGKMQFISNVSSGLTDDQKANWAAPALYPMVWKVEYKDRRYKSQGDDTNALDFAAFVELRTDKKPEECINPEL